MAEGISRKEAAERIRQEELGRERYLKQNFREDVHNPLLYHLVINTDLVTPDDAVDLIASMVRNRIPGAGSRRSATQTESVTATG